MKNLLFLLPIYLLILAANGYTFGSGDQVEVLPYALFLGDSSLYPADFYVQYISQAIPNERYFFSKALSLSGNALPFACGFLHLCCSLLLLGGLYRISQLFIHTSILRWGALLLLCLPPLYGINLGGNELYYNTFIPSLLAKSIGIWGLYFFLQQQYTRSLSLLVLCTFFHPVAGAQLFLLLGGVLIWDKIQARADLSWLKIGALFLAFMATAGAWVLFLKLNFDKGIIESALLFEIMEFRVPHHYFPTYFPLKYYLLLLPLFLFGLAFYWRKNKSLSVFFFLTLLGCGCYTIGVELIGSTSLLTAQWYKSTIWLKALSIIALLAWVESKMSTWQTDLLSKAARWALAGLSLLAIGILLQPQLLFPNKSYDFFWKTPSSAIIDIAQQARAKTAKEAVFAIPLPETAFKFHSQRSCYIDYKTVVHRKDALPVWYDRIQTVYGIELGQRQAGENLNVLAQQHFAERSEVEWRALAAGKFQFLLTTAQPVLGFPVIGENKAYKIYRID